MGVRDLVSRKNAGEKRPFDHTTLTSERLCNESNVSAVGNRRETHTSTSSRRPESESTGAKHDRSLHHAHTPNDSAASLHTEELSRRSNAVCPTSLDSHKFHCIVRPTYRVKVSVPEHTSKPEHSHRVGLLKRGRFNFRHRIRVYSVCVCVYIYCVIYTNSTSQYSRFRTKATRISGVRRASRHWYFYLKTYFSV